MNNLEMTAIENFTNAGIKVFTPDGNQLQRLEIENLFQQAHPYIAKLNKLSAIFSADQSLMEFIVIHRFNTNFKQQLTKRFPYVNIEDNKIQGAVGCGYYTIFIDKNFEKYSKKVRTFFKTDTLKPFYVVTNGIDRFGKTMSPMELFNLIAEYSL